MPRKKPAGTQATATLRVVEVPAAYVNEQFELQRRNEPGGMWFTLARFQHETDALAALRRMASTTPRVVKTATCRELAS